jgi:sulfite exporter TauE/SafE
MGALFIFWGIKSIKGNRAEIRLPKFISRIYQYVFRNYVSRAGRHRSFLIGLISIMLPCGLIYGLIIAAIALGSYEQVMISLLFFWLGTLPAMVGAPQLMKKVLQPLKAKLPKVYAVLFIVIGVTTIAGRLNHSSPGERTKLSPVVHSHSCH